MFIHMYPQIFSHIFPQIINFFIYKYYPQIFSPKYSHVSIHNYSRIFILRNCLPSHRYSCLPTHMFLPLPFLRFVFLVRTQIALAIIVAYTWTFFHHVQLYICTVFSPVRISAWNLPDLLRIHAVQIITQWLIDFCLFSILYDLL